MLRVCVCGSVCACVSVRVCVRVFIFGSKVLGKKSKKRNSVMAASVFCISVRVEWHSNKVC